MEEGGIWELRSYLYRLWGVGAGESHTHLGGSGYGGVAASRFDMG